MNRRLALLTALAVLCLAQPVRAEPTADTARPLSEFPREHVVVTTRSARRHVFDAWRAETPEMREQGLMFVPSMREDQAMIFVYDAPEMVAMWMKNTLLTLDMLFVDRGGCIVTIKERAQPGSLATIESHRPVSLVVELQGGTVAARGIHVGDRVERPDAGWPARPGACTATR